ncbi:hypothetical protein PGTUg99_037444 [Puccinia graminis f. sp. tritici]|uniref:Uncharacterized protein n=1 Tax=Puccinia graminis f. sp. tritici TaxID=56615 RepID=A0A5B0PQG0_PUCGR|nr:hypothetical protein PGTUg99_037444 [Puccinia graminis f. sp. tritici]
MELHPSVDESPLLLLVKDGKKKRRSGQPNQCRCCHRSDHQSQHHEQDGCRCRG